MKQTKGFTLIELLIVVAIIAILAAIAIPNFLAAQTRSKVTKSKSEMRNLGTALESYYVDFNMYPRGLDTGDPATSFYNVPNCLSTPVAYVTNVLSFYDPFSLRHSGPSIYHRYGYISADWPGDWWNAYLSTENKERAGKWHLDGYGPTEGRARGWPNQPSYDATNGTISNGAIYRSQKDPLGIQF